MSAQVPSYEDAVAKIAALEKDLTELKTHQASKKGAEDDEDKKQEASFKKAMEEVEKKDKEHSATHDEHEKVKDAFKKAQDESDPEKKKEAMKRAMDMKDEHDKKARKGEEKPEENVDKQKEHEAKIASIVMKKIPLMQKILEATKIMDASNYDKVAKQLEAATLEQVQEKYDTIAPYLAAVGVGSKATAGQAQQGMIPFQASGAINTDDIFEADVDSIDFSKVPTDKLMGMYK